MNFSLMDIQVTEQFENPFGNHVICFRIDHVPYLLITDTNQTSKKTYPLEIHHDMSIPGNDDCHFCTHEVQSPRRCTPLERYLNDLFLHLIEQKPIRLNWLYIDYQLNHTKKENE